MYSDCVHYEKICTYPKNTAKAFNGKFKNIEKNLASQIDDLDNNDGNYMPYLKTNITINYLANK